VVEVEVVVAFERLGDGVTASIQDEPLQRVCGMASTVAAWPFDIEVEYLEVDLELDRASGKTAPAFRRALARNLRGGRDSKRKRNRAILPRCQRKLTPPRSRPVPKWRRLETPPWTLRAHP
jgi:hypothetical protein